MEITHGGAPNHQPGNDNPPRVGYEGRSTITGHPQNNNTGKSISSDAGSSSTETQRSQALMFDNDHLITQHIGNKAE